MKVAGAILKQVKNASKQASRRKHPSAKSIDYIEAVRPVSHDIDKLHRHHRSSTISQSSNQSELITIRSSNKSATLPGHYRTS